MVHVMYYSTRRKRLAFLLLAIVCLVFALVGIGGAFVAFFVREYHTAGGMAVAGLGLGSASVTFYDRSNGYDHNR
jgi:hypothetical protein